MTITKLFNEFFESEKSAGLILIACTVLSISFSNLSSGGDYIHFWHQNLGFLTIEGWVNDGLMAIFFLMIGLELEREIYKGELSNFREALLPILAAIGGMLIPALIYFSINQGTPMVAGTGIPMATDIAFALGILSLLGNRVPLSLKIFLTALAVIDDIGAIAVIALFYTKVILWKYLAAVFAIWLGLLMLNRLKIHFFAPYLIGGLAMWYYMYLSGVHASISGVMLAFVIPFGDGGQETVSYKVQKALHFPVAFVILPIFALANTAILFDSNFMENSMENYSLGILLGLVLGKPLGIMLFSYFAVKFKFSKLPSDTNWRQILGIGFLGGIGFTMSIFITLLSFEQASVVSHAKWIILASSVLAGSIGYFILNQTIKSK